MNFHPRVNGELTWQAEFFFISSLLRHPRYLNSVEKPYALFGNDDMLSMWRMVEQAVSRRGIDDPLLTYISREELMVTGEHNRSDVDLKTLWEDLSNPSIMASPEKWHNVLQHYAALRILDERVCGRFSQLSSVGPEETISAIQQDVFGVNINELYQSRSLQSVMKEVWDSRYSGRRAKIRTGFKQLDSVIGALIPGCTYLFCARTSHGKSTCLAEMANNQARDGHRVGVIGMEDSYSVWASRWMSRTSGVKLRRIRDNVLSVSLPDENDMIQPLLEEEKEAIEFSTKAAHLDNIFITDAKGARLSDVLRIMNELVVRKGCSIIWLDYLQAIYASGGDNRSRRDFLEFAWAKLEHEATKLEVPLMLTAQLNREWEKDPLPSMPGLRHTEWLGAAEQKCYVGVVIYRPYKDTRLDHVQQQSRFNELLFNVEKAKQGESKAIEFHFDPAACVVREV